MAGVGFPSVANYAPVTSATASGVTASPAGDVGGGGLVVVLDSEVALLTDPDGLILLAEDGAELLTG